MSSDETHPQKRYGLGPILIFFIIATILCAIFSRILLLYVGTFTAILAAIWLVNRWEDIVVWFYTAGKNKH